MPLSDEQLARIKAMSEDDLVRGAETPDLAVVVEANLRLKRATEKLTRVLIWLTGVLVFLTLVLVVEGVVALCRS